MSPGSPRNLQYLDPTLLRPPFSLISPVILSKMQKIDFLSVVHVIHVNNSAPGIQYYVLAVVI